MKKLKVYLTTVLSLMLVLSGCSSKKDVLDPDHPVQISLWHYYNGAQQESFNDLIREFNDTVGKEKGIIVKASGQGNVNDLENNVLDSINGEAGVAEIPNIFAAYADTAYTVDRLGYAVDLTKYFTKKELEEYISSYIEEGEFSNDGSLKIFPIAKSTEIFMLNKTDWDKFSKATGTSLDELKTIEGVTKVSQKYYEWSDSLTEEKNDGKAFFGRDALANYFIIGFRQNGVQIFEMKDGIVTLNYDKEIVKKLWDNYYVPYIKGYFASSGRFCSDDIKTGNIIAFVGSSSGATFFPKEVILNDNESYKIEMSAFVAPQFENGEAFAVQQGAGMVVTKSDEAKETACAEFLKWFTKLDQNVKFSVDSGYLPVTKAANDKDVIKEKITTTTETEQIIDKAIDTIHQSTLYTTKAFENGTKARNVLEYSLSDKASEDRKSVLADMKNGKSYEEAVSQFDNDKNFEAWYNETYAQLKELVK